MYGATQMPFDGKNNYYSPQTMYFRLLGRPLLGRLLLGRPLLGRPLLGRTLLGCPLLGRPLLGRPLLGRQLLGRPLLGRQSSSWETRPKGGYSQLVYIYNYIYIYYMRICMYECMLLLLLFVDGCWATI